MILNKTILLHLTDFHFGEDIAKNFASGNNTYFEIADIVIEKLKLLKPNRIIVAIGGDVANRSDKNRYLDAHKFMQHIEKALIQVQFDYIICPGNHDLNRDLIDSFEDFNRFAGQITKQERFMYSDEDTSMLFEAENWSFVTANSVWKRDTKLSEIEINGLKKNLESAIHPIIILTHHHFIPIIPKDISAIGNAYEVMKLCSHYNVKLVLHGHVHTSFRLDVGLNNRTFSIAGAGAILPKLDGNYNNQFNIYDLGEGDFTLYPYLIKNDSVTKPGAVAILNNL